MYAIYTGYLTYLLHLRVMDWRQTGMYSCIPAIAYSKYRFRLHTCAQCIIHIYVLIFSTFVNAVVFGMPQEDAEAKKSFAKLMDEHFPVLMNEYLKDTQFCYSDKVTIADLSIAPVLTFLKCRPKFWAKVPEKVKDYYTRVLEAFPDTKGEL